MWPQNDPISYRHLDELIRLYSVWMDVQSYIYFSFSTSLQLTFIKEVVEGDEVSKRLDWIKKISP